MKPARRGVLWWSLTIVLAVGVVGAGGFGAWQVAHHPVQSVQGAPADSAQARQVVVDVAKASTVKLLSYTPDTVETNRDDAPTLTTGDFRDSYTKLMNDTVVPTAKSKNITTTATVPGAAVESLGTNTATLIMFINQVTTTPPDEPKSTVSTVRVILQKVNGDWLIAKFDPL